jgi:hypothetical protein
MNANPRDRLLPVLAQQAPAPDRVALYLQDRRDRNEAAAQRRAEKAALPPTRARKVFDLVLAIAGLIFMVVIFIKPVFFVLLMIFALISSIVPVHLSGGASGFLVAYLVARSFSRCRC